MPCEPGYYNIDGTYNRSAYEIEEDLSLEEAAREAAHQEALYAAHQEALYAAHQEALYAAHQAAVDAYYEAAREDALYAAREAELDAELDAALELELEEAYAQYAYETLVAQDVQAAEYDAYLEAQYANFDPANPHGASNLRARG